MPVSCAYIINSCVGQFETYYQYWLTTTDAKSVEIGKELPRKLHMLAGN